MSLQHLALATDEHRRPIDFTELLWSSPAGWSGFTLQRHRVGPVGGLRDFVVPDVLLGVCVAGRAEVDVGTAREDERVVLEPGRFILLDSGAAQRSIRWTGDRETLYLRLGSQEMERLMPEAAGHDRLRVRPQFGRSDPQLRRLALCMAEEARAGNPSGALFAEALSVALAAYLRAHYGAHPASARRATQTFDTAMRSRMQHYVQAHLARNVTLVELAGVAGLSPHYFLEVFRNTFGATPHHYLLCERIEHAKHLLTRGQASICDIGLALGFADQSHVTTTFRRLAGVTPAHYRRRRDGSS